MLAPPRLRADIGAIAQVLTLTLLSTCSQAPTHPPIESGVQSTPARQIAASKPFRIDQHRDAGVIEIFGAWERESRWPGRGEYLVILKDGRIGWIFTEARLERPTRSALIGMLEAKTVPHGMTRRWARAAVSPGNVTEFRQEGTSTFKAYYVFWVVEQVGSPNSSYPGAHPGDVVMAQYYKDLPPRAVPEPLEVYRLHRLAD